jgi:short-subunit dehydrogenase
MKKKALIIGGSSGLGLEIAQLLSINCDVIITGRKNPSVPSIMFQELELGSESLEKGLDKLIKNLPKIDLLIYAAGFFQEGKIDQLSDNDIHVMNRVGLLAPAMILQRVLHKQGELHGFVAITSTSQWTPRLLEPMYTAVKAGLGMLANSLSLDDRIQKVLVAGPAGMRTRFWERDGRDTSDMLDPKWVAEQILEIWKGSYGYKYVRLL